MFLTRAARLQLANGIGDVLDTVRTSVGTGTSSTDKNKSTGITISTWNIVDGRGNRLKLACRQLQRLNINITFLTETKLNRYHTINSYGYNIVSTKCRHMHQGGVTLAYKYNKHWHIESPKSFGDNVLKCTLVHGCQRTILTGIYIPPSEDNMETIKNLDRAVHNVDQKTLLFLATLILTTIGLKMDVQ